MADYLWDKSGRDADVEQLEETLGKLRYRGAPPDFDAVKLPATAAVSADARVADARVADARGTTAPARADRSSERAFVSRRDRPLLGGRRSSLVAGLVLGLMAGVVAYSAIQKREADVRRGWNLVPVVVAAQDIPEGTVVTFDMVSQRSVPEQFVTSSVVKPDSASYVVNQKVRVPIQAGDPLLWSEFETTRAAERLSTKVQMKTRAVSIEAGATASVGGWVRPNDHVDVIGSFRDPQTNENVAVTLLQNVIVLATGKITGTTNVSLIPENQRDYTNVSLLVLPEEAELLVLANELGSLTLSLRNEDDVDLIEDRGRATIQTLLSGERTRVLEARRREVISIIRGNASGSAPGAASDAPSAPPPK